MKLILLTTPYFFIEEHKILNAFFDEGLEILHLRKPNTEAVYSERLLSLIPDEYHKRIVTHDHFYLKKEYGLKGIHLNHRNPSPPAGYKGHISCSCHSAEEIASHRRSCDYVFLSPVFDSISKEGYHTPFTPARLQQLAERKIIDRRVMALGGITLQHIPVIRDLGFGGAVVLGDIWNRISIHSTENFKELMLYFHQLKKATEG